MALQTYDYPSAINFIKDYIEEKKTTPSSLLSEELLYDWIQTIETNSDRWIKENIQIMVSNSFKHFSGIMILKNLISTDKQHRNEEETGTALKGFILAKTERSLRDLLLSLPDQSEIVLSYHEQWTKGIIEEFLFQTDRTQPLYICGYKKSHSNFDNTMSYRDMLHLNYKNEITIDSKKHMIVKELKELNSLNGRVKNNKFVVEGSLLVKRALTDGHLVDKVICCGDLEQSDIKEIFYLCRKRGIPYYTMPAGIMTSVTDTKPLPNVLASIDIRIKTEKDLFLTSESTFMILDGVKNPDNIGMILRSADASGVDAVILLSNSTHFLSKNSIRAARGAVGRTAIYMCENDDDFFQLLHQNGFQIIGTSAKAENDSFYNIKFKEKVALIVGNESHGIRNNIIDQCTEFIKIPMAQGQSSLNVVVAASLILYEAVRKHYTT